MEIYNVNDTHEARFLIGVWDPHTENRPYNITVHDTDCRRFRLLSHPSQRLDIQLATAGKDPMALRLANHPQEEQSARASHSAPYSSRRLHLHVHQATWLTWRCHLWKWHIHLYGPNTVPNLSLRHLWSIPYPIGCIWKKKSVVTERKQALKNFPIASHIHHGHICGTDSQAA